MHYSLLKSLIAFGLLSTAMARDYHYRDTPARQTPAVESPEYDAGLSPLPTPEPGLELRGAVLGPRSLASDNCGYRQREDGGFGALRCVDGIDCRTVGSHFGCLSVPYTRCFDGTEAICQQSATSLGALSRCCTQSNSVYLPYCVTFLKEDGGQKTMLRCGQPIHGNRRIMFLGSETDDPDATRTVASIDASPTTASSSQTQDSQTTSSISSTMPTPTPDPPSSGGGSNTGAIVGGVVTSVAVVAIAACIIVWLVLRRRRQAREDAAAGGAPGGLEMPATPGQQSQFSQPYHGGGYQDQPAQGGYDEQQYKQQQPIYEVPGNNTGNRNVAELGA